MTISRVLLHAYNIVYNQVKHTIVNDIIMQCCRIPGIFAGKMFCLKYFHVVSILLPDFGDQNWYRLTLASYPGSEGEEKESGMHRSRMRLTDVLSRALEWAWTNDVYKYEPDHDDGASCASAMDRCAGAELSAHTRLYCLLTTLAMATPSCLCRLCQSSVLSAHAESVWPTSKSYYQNL